MGEEPALYGRLDEEAQPLLGVNHLQRMLARCLDCRGLQGDGCESAAELVDLRGKGVSAWGLLSFSFGVKRGVPSRSEPNTRLRRGRGAVVARG